MSRSRITNLIATSVVIEDLGVHLPCKGSSAIVDTNSASRSKNLQEQRRWVRVESIPEVKPVPLWPFTSIRSKPEVHQSSSDQPSMNDIREMITALSHKTQALIDTIASKDLSVSIPPEILAAVSKVSSSQNAPVSNQTFIKNDIPMFIPSQIVPQSADAKIHAREESTSVTDMDASLEALRKARKSK